VEVFSTLLQSFVPGRENHATKRNTYMGVSSSIDYYLEHEGASSYVSISALLCGPKKVLIEVTTHSCRKKGLDLSIIKIIIVQQS
jgi:hypothetical protein